LWTKWTDHAVRLSRTWSKLVKPGRSRSLGWTDREGHRPGMKVGDGFFDRIYGIWEWTEWTLWTGWTARAVRLSRTWSRLVKPGRSRSLGWTDREGHRPGMKVGDGFFDRIYGIWEWTEWTLWTGWTARAVRLSRTWSRLVKPGRSRSLGWTDREGHRPGMKVGDGFFDRIYGIWEWTEWTLWTKWTSHAVRLSRTWSKLVAPEAEVGLRGGRNRRRGWGICKKNAIPWQAIGESGQPLLWRRAGTWG